MVNCSTISSSKKKTLNTVSIRYFSFKTEMLFGPKELIASSEALNAVSIGTSTNFVIRIQLGESGQGGSGLSTESRLEMSEDLDPHPPKNEMASTKRLSNTELSIERYKI